MKLALFRDITIRTDITSVFDIEKSDWVLEHDDYVQVSEVIEVELPALKDVDIVTKQVGFIDNKIKQVQAVSEAKITELTQQRNELLALPSPDQEQVT